MSDIIYQHIFFFIKIITYKSYTLCNKTQVITYKYVHFFMIKKINFIIITKIYKINLYKNILQK